MTRHQGFRGIVLVVAIGAGLVASMFSAPGARAEGGGACSFDGLCAVADIVPPSGTGGGKGDSADEADTRRDLPECTSFDAAYTDIPEDAANPEDWVQVPCLEGHLPMTLWVEGAPNPDQIARTLLARVQLAPIRIGLTPLGDPADVMTVVGMPVWLWVDDPSRTTWGPATISAGGVTLTARVGSVTWDLGDGTTIRCGKGTVWRSGDGGAPSPTCGHTYEVQGRYTIRARSHWVASWSGYGRSGTIPVTTTASRRLDVGEVQVIVTGGK